MNFCYYGGLHYNSDPICEIQRGSRYLPLQGWVTCYFLTPSRRPPGAFLPPLSVIKSGSGQDKPRQGKTGIGHSHVLLISHRSCCHRLLGLWVDRKVAIGRHYPIWLSNQFAKNPSLPFSAPESHRRCKRCIRKFFHQVV